MKDIWKQIKAAPTWAKGLMIFGGLFAILLVIGLIAGDSEQGGTGPSQQQIEAQAERERAAREARREARKEALAAARRQAKREASRRRAAEQRRARARQARQKRREERAEARAAAEAKAEEQVEPEASSSCDPNYSPCVPVYPPDVNCADIAGPVQVIGSDPHGLDADGDGVGCES